jgi:triacylglycerol lipase
MRRSYVIVVGVIFMASLLGAPAFAADTSCKTKYPIIMVHGMGFISNSVYPNSFPGIGEALTARGATIYFTNVDSLQATRVKAEQFAAEFQKIQALYPAGTKFNIIAHSHGGVYTRDAISNLGLYPYVASLTTVDTPHRGANLAQLYADIKTYFPWLLSLMAGMTPFPGDQQYLDVNLLNLSTSYMQNTFNPNTPNKSGIYYQSWAGEFRVYNMFAMLGDFLNSLIQQLTGTYKSPKTPQEYVAAFHKAFPDTAAAQMLIGGGFNDGLVPEYSAKWGTYLGADFGYWWTYGIDHVDAVNINPNGVNFDVIGTYVNFVKKLKAKGY